jgi:alpha-tubulin suppressor-like RCC1 family protein
VKADDALQCWGDDSSGQVSGPNRDGAGFATVSAGGMHTCGIKTGGALTCWGDDTFGQVSGPNGAPYR